MKSRTSSCKKTVFRKDLTRFAPVWLAWLVFLGLILVSMNDSDQDFWFPANMGSATQVMGIFTCGYALLVVQALFGDLYNSRMCHGLHALPLKREHWFDAHVKAGIWFCAIPSAVVAAVAVFWMSSVSAMANVWQIPLYWWAAINLSYLFFFGVGVFSAMCVGNRLGMVMVYGLLNFASLMVYFLADFLYVPLLRGVLTPESLFLLFCPVAELCTRDYMDCFRHETGRTYLNAFGVERPVYDTGFTVMAEGWEYLLIVAALGLVVLVLARMLYRERKLECAGDFAAARAQMPIYQVLLTLMVMTCFGVLYAMLFGDTEKMLIYIAVGLFIGWFAVKMFLTRSTRVFAPKNWLGLGILTAALAASLFVTKLDPLGLEQYIPAVEQVSSARIFLQNYGEEFGTENPEEIGDLMFLHTLALQGEELTEQEAIQSRNMGEDPALSLRISYTLENGMEVRREYYIRVNSQAGNLAEKYFSDIRALTHNSQLHGGADKEKFLAMAAEAESLYVFDTRLEGEYLTEAFIEELMAAIAADCEAGNMAQTSYFHDTAFYDTEERTISAIHMDFHLKNDFWMSVQVFADCENTVAVLEKTGIPQRVREGARYLVG